MWKTGLAIGGIFVGVLLFVLEVFFLELDGVPGFLMVAAGAVFFVEGMLALFLRGCRSAGEKTANVIDLVMDVVEGILTFFFER